MFNNINCFLVIIFMLLSVSSFTFLCWLCNWYLAAEFSTLVNKELLLKIIIIIVVIMIIIKDTNFAIAPTGNTVERTPQTWNTRLCVESEMNVK
jgi:hypothetical protein